MSSTGYSGQVEHPHGVIVLVLGILGIVGVGITGPFAWFIGSRARKEVAAGRYAESSALTIGWVLGMISTVLLGLALLFVVGTVVLGLGLGWVLN